MRLKAMIVLIVALMMVTLGLAGCGEGGGDGEKVTIRIGLTAPLSGMGAGYGQDIKAGLDMAINEVNADGGVTIGDTTYVFELLAADDESTPEAALSNAQRFILEEDINIIWDPVATTIRPLIGINNKAGEEFLMMAYTSVPLYTTAVNPLMVTLPPPFSVYVGEFTKMAMGKGWTKLGMVQTTGAYGELWGSTMEKAWTGAGGTVVGKAPASYYTETDFTAYLTTVLAGNPDVILVGGPSDPTALVIDQARSLGFKGGFMVMDQAKLDQIAEVTGMEKLEGAIGVLPVESAAADWPFVTDFVKQYEEENEGKLVTWETAICYTGFNMLVSAMKEAGSVTDVTAIRAGFAKGDASVTSGEEFPVAFSGIDNATGALWMPGTATIVENGQFIGSDMIEWWKK